MSCCGTANSPSDRQERIPMNNRAVIDPIPVSLPEEDVLLRFHAKPGDEAAEELIALAKAAAEAARPKAVCRLCPSETRGDIALLDGKEFPFRLLAVNLSRSHKALAYVVTCGTELEAWASGLTDPVEQFWADGIMEMWLHKASAWFTDHIRNTYFAGGKISQMSPGSLKEWPLSQQQDLFALIGEVPEAIGVTLRPSYLMTPFKSISGLAFPAEDGYENCRLCPMANCPGRRAPMDPAYAAEKFGLQL